jgi:hypothetical protein
MNPTLQMFRALARLTLDAHKLTDWTFAFSTGRKRLGYCSYRRRRITVSKLHVLMDSMASAMDTLNHEVAHALVGPGHGHGSEWAAKAVELGAEPKACSRTAVPLRWRAVCGACSRVYVRNRKLRNRIYFCRFCGLDRGVLSYVRASIDAT